MPSRFHHMRRLPARTSANRATNETRTDGHGELVRHARAWADKLATAAEHPAVSLTPGQAFDLAITLQRLVGVAR